MFWLIRMLRDRLTLSNVLPIVTICSLTILNGCGSNWPTAQKNGAGRNLEKTDDNDNAGIYEADKNVVVLEHEFGVLKPKTKVEYCFTIKNPSNGKWTVRKIVNMCACTVSDISAPVIAAGKQETVTVTYHAGRGSRDDQRKVVVLFDEADAPRIILVVYAKIREDMTVNPAEVTFLEMGRGQTQHGSFEVHNFGDVRLGFHYG